MQWDKGGAAVKSMLASWGPHDDDDDGDDADGGGDDDDDVDDGDDDDGDDDNDNEDVGRFDDCDVPDWPFTTV